MRPDQSSFDLLRQLCRPIVFTDPDRVVPPGSWLEHIPFAFWAVDVVRPNVLVELGTQSGNSYSAFAQAIQQLELPSTAYAVDTWSGDSQAGFYDETVFTEWAAYHDRHFASFSRLVRSTFAEAATHFANGSVDLLHLDGCHTYEAVTADFETWLPKLSQRAVVLVHDINVRERDFGAWRFWEQWHGRFPSFAFHHSHGLGVLAVGPDAAEPIQWLGSTSEADAVEIRRFFVRLGSAISARFEHQQIEQARSAVSAAAEQLKSEVAALAVEREELSQRCQQEAARRSELEQVVATLQDNVARLHQDAASSAGRAALALEIRERLATETARRRELEEQLAAARRRPDAASGGTNRSGSAAGTRGPRWWALLRHPQAIRDLLAVRTSGLFDANYYVTSYPDVAGSGLDPLTHFVLHGAAEGRSPHPLFDSAYYRRRYRDVAAAAINPLAHYVRRGRIELRNPHPLFDVAHYLQANQDVAAAGLDPLRHFLDTGASEQRNPNPYFDCAYYLAANPEVARSGVNPLLHYATEGWRQRRRPSPDFDPEAYAAEYFDVAGAAVDPLAHFLELGQPDGRSPIPARTRATDQPGAVLHEAPPVRLQVRTPATHGATTSTILVVSPYLPLPDRSGNELRAYRLLRWLHRRGYRIVAVIAPPAAAQVTDDDLARAAAELSNVIVCHADGRVNYLVADVPDVLSALSDDFARPASLLLDHFGVEKPQGAGHSPLCHDTLVTALLQLQHVVSPYVVLGDVSISEVLPLLTRPLLKLLDTAGEHGAMPAAADATRLWRADHAVALDETDRAALDAAAPGLGTITAGIDCEVVRQPGVAAEPRVLCTAPDTADNRSALSEFLRFAWPRIRLAVPDAELVVMGPLAEAVAGLHLPGVSTAAAPAGDPVYAAIRVAISPASGETGLRREALEAVSHGRPVVTWGSAAHAVPAAFAHLCLTASDWFEFARHVQTMLTAAPADPGDDGLDQRCSGDTTYGALDAVLQDVFTQAAGARPAEYAARV